MAKAKRIFGDKTYTAHGKYYGKREAQKEAEKMREKGYNARVTQTAWGNHIVWVRKKGR